MFEVETEALASAGEIRVRLYELPRHSTVHLVCANGARSLDLIPFLRAASGHNPRRLR